MYAFSARSALYSEMIALIPYSRTNRRDKGWLMRLTGKETVPLLDLKAKNSMACTDVCLQAAEVQRMRSVNVVGSTSREALPSKQTILAAFMSISQ